MHLRPWGGGGRNWHLSVARPRGEHTRGPQPGRGPMSPLALPRAPTPRGSEEPQSRGPRALLVPTVTRPGPASVSASFPEKGSLPSRPGDEQTRHARGLQPQEPAQGLTASPPRSQRHVGGRDPRGERTCSQNRAASDLLSTRRRRERRFPSRQQPRASHSLSSVASKPGSRRPVQHPCRLL